MSNPIYVMSDNQNGSYGVSNDGFINISSNGDTNAVFNKGLTYVYNLLDQAWLTEDGLFAWGLEDSGFWMLEG